MRSTRTSARPLSMAAFSFAFSLRAETAATGAETGAGAAMLASVGAIAAGWGSFVVVDNGEELAGRSW